MGNLLWLLLLAALWAADNVDANVGVSRATTTLNRGLPSITPPQSAQSRGWTIRNLGGQTIPAPSQSAISRAFTLDQGFAIYGITPREVGADDATLAVFGNKFAAQASIYLRRDPSDRLDPVGVSIAADGRSLHATFHFQPALGTTWDLIVDNEDGSRDTLGQAVTVVSPNPPNLVAGFIGPSFVRLDRRGHGTAFGQVRVRNFGNIDSRRACIIVRSDANVVLAFNAATWLSAGDALGICCEPALLDSSAGVTMAFIPPLGPSQDFLIPITVTPPASDSFTVDCSVTSDQLADSAIAEFRDTTAAVIAANDSVSAILNGEGISVAQFQGALDEVFDELGLGLSTPDSRTRPKALAASPLSLRPFGRWDSIRGDTLEALSRLLISSSKPALVEVNLTAALPP